MLSLDLKSCSSFLTLKYILRNHQLNPLLNSAICICLCLALYNDKHKVWQNKRLRGGGGGGGGGGDTPDILGQSKLAESLDYVRLGRCRVVVSQYLSYSNLCLTLMAGDDCGAPRSLPD